MKHPNDMTRDELREVVSAMSWLSLDLAQNLSFIVNMLKREYVADALRGAIQQAYDLSHYPYNEDRINPKAKAQVSVFSEGGLTVERFDEISDLFEKE